MVDRWYAFVYWLEDNLQWVLAAALLVGFVCVMFVFTSKGKNEVEPLVKGVKGNTLEEVEAVKELSAEIDDVFSLLEERRVGVSEEYPAYELDVYLKKPFIREKEFKDALKTYVEIYKWKEEYQLSGLKIRVYDRKEVFDKNLVPRSTVYYYKKLDTNKMLTEEEGGERLYGDDVVDINFRETIDLGEKPNYKDYEIRVGVFKTLNNAKSVTPLTDQEFSFYLKMDMYSTILGGSKYGGASLYLQWDLGKDVYKDGIVAIEREFERFEKRHIEIGAQQNYYDNPFILKQQLAVEKPQFLLFALTKQVVDDPLDAQRELIKEDPELYRGVLEEHIEEQLKEFTEEEKEEAEENKETTEQDEQQVKDTGVENESEEKENSETEEYTEFKGNGG